MKPSAVFHVTILVLLLAAGSAGAAQRYAKGDVLVVLSKPGLNIREKADMRSKIVGQAPLGALVTMEEEPSGAVLTVEGIGGRWVKVAYRDIAGFAFDGLLSRLRAPEEGCDSLEDYFIREFKSAGSQAERRETGEGTEVKITELFFSNGASIVHRQIISLSGGADRSVSTYTIPGIERVEEAFLLLKLLGYIEAEFPLPAVYGNAGHAKDGAAVRAAVVRKGGEVQSLDLTRRKPDFSGQESSASDLPGIAIRKEGEGITIELRNVKK